METYQHMPRSRSQRDWALYHTYAYFELRYEQQATPLESWQLLCRDIGIRVEDTVNKCRRSAKSVPINLIDFALAERKPEDVWRFGSLTELRNYSNRNRMWFPKERAKANTVLHGLLQHMHSRRGRSRKARRPRNDEGYIDDSMFEESPAYPYEDDVVESTPALSRASTPDSLIEDQRATATPDPSTFVMPDEEDIHDNGAAFDRQMANDFDASQGAEFNMKIAQQLAKLRLLIGVTGDSASDATMAVDPIANLRIKLGLPTI